MPGMPTNQGAEGAGGRATVWHTCQGPKFKPSMKTEERGCEVNAPWLSGLLMRSSSRLSPIAA